MADAVQLALEEMIPELEDLKRRGLFTDAEIKLIVKKRRHFEYLVRGRQSTITEFSDYIRYEIALEALRVRRRDRAAKQARNKQQKKTTLSDFAGPRRIHLLFARGLRRFHGNVGFWKQYLAYARKTKSNAALTKAYARALQLHPTHASLWHEAALWEFEENQNMTAARSHLQSGLRILSSSRRLWLAYFRLELRYMRKLRERQALLAPDTAPAEDAAEGELTVWQGAVPKAIYLYAIKALPEDFLFRIDFLRICAEFSEVGPRLAQFIEESTIASFQQEAAMWDALARTSTAAVHTFERAVATVPSSDMFARYAAFLYEKKERDKLVEVAERATRMACTSPTLFKLWATCLLESHHIDEGLKVLRDCTAAFPASEDAWLMLLSTSVRASAFRAPAGPFEDVSPLFEQALRQVPAAQTGSLWLSYLQYSLARGTAVLDKLFERALAAHPNHPELQTLYVNSTMVLGGVQHARGAISKLQRGSAPLSLPLLMRCLRVELSALQVDAARVRALFERAAADHPTCRDLWRDYLRFESSGGHFDRVSLVFQRATVALPDETEFLSQFLSTTEC